MFHCRLSNALEWGDDITGRYAALRSKKKKQNLLPAASKVIILQHHQGSQIGIYIDPNFLTSKTINQKNAGLEKR